LKKKEKLKMDEKDIENDTMDNPDMFNQDLEQLNVNVWFNKLESRLQYCLVKDNPRDGFMQYKMLVNQAILIALSGGKMDEKEFDTDVKTLIDKELKESDTNDVKEMREAMIKYRVVLSNILKTKKSELNLSY